MSNSRKSQNIEVDGSVAYIFPESACAMHICADQPGKLVLIKQWRELQQRETLELPGGKIERGESPSDAAIRELREEAKIVAENSSVIVGLDLDFSVSKHRTYLVSTSSRTSEALPAHVFLCDLKEAWSKVEAGSITHAPTVSAILYLLLKGLRP